jgi:hypothetical protein
MALKHTKCLLIQDKFYYHARVLLSEPYPVTGFVRIEVVTA